LLRGGADKPLARPGRKEATVNTFLQEKKLDSSRLDVVEIAHVA